MPRRPSTRVMPAVYSNVFGDARPSSMAVLTPGRIGLPRGGRLVPPVALNQSHNCSSAASVVRGFAGLPVFTSGPAYEYWNVAGLPPADALSPALLVRPAT